jgi:hypothetical protein
MYVTYVNGVYSLIIKVLRTTYRTLFSAGTVNQVCGSCSLQPVSEDPYGRFERAAVSGVMSRSAGADSAQPAAAAPGSIMSRSGGPGTLAMGAVSSSPCPAGRHHFATFQLPPAPSPRLAANRPPPPVLMTKSAPAEGLEYLGGGGMVAAMSRNNNNNINSNKSSSSNSSSRLELTNKNRNDNADSHGTGTLSKGLLHFII